MRNPLGYKMKNIHFSNKRRALLKTGASALLLPAAALSPALAANKDYGILGHSAPELEVTEWIDAKGNPTPAFKLADHKDKYIFMEFWQSWCPGCHSHGLPGLKKIADAFEGSPHFSAISIQTTFEGYATNTAKKMRKIQKQYDLKIMMGHDGGDEKTHSHPKTMVSYRSGGTPWAVLISPERKVIFNGFSINPDSAIKHLEKAINKMS